MKAAGYVAALAWGVRINLLSQIFAGATGLALIAVGLLEIFFHGDRRFYRIFLIKSEDVPGVRRWAMNVGAYNIAFGPGIASGLWMVNFSGNVASGSAIVIFCCARHVILGIWLWITEKRLLTSAIGQAFGRGLALVSYLILPVKTAPSRTVDHGRRPRDCCFFSAM